MNSIGLKRGTVELSPYDDAWPRLFEAEKQQILVALDGLIFELEHVGSTSVPGLAAKPLIDTIASMRSLSDYTKAIAPLRALGYEFMPERVFKDRVFFPKGPRDNRTFHLSLVKENSEQWIDTLLFRDYLRDHPTERHEYQALKQKLALKFADNRQRYTEAKRGFISSVLELSRK